jgi:hypothetical protein
VLRSEAHGGVNTSSTPNFQVLAGNKNDLYAIIPQATTEAFHNSVFDHTQLLFGIAHGCHVPLEVRKMVLVRRDQATRVTITERTENLNLFLRYQTSITVPGRNWLYPLQCLYC